MENSRSKWVWKELEDVENKEETCKMNDSMNVYNQKYNE